MTKLKILFYIAKPYSVPVTQSLRELAYQTDDIEPLCFISPKLSPLFEREPATIELAEAVSFKPDIVFCPGNYVHDSISGIKVQLFHGLGYEKRGHFRIRGFFQLYCTPGPLITRRFEKLAAWHKTFIVKETGWPKMDLLFRNAPPVPELTEITKGKKVILYAPTFSRRLTSVPKLLPALATLPKENEFVIIKLHDLHDKREMAELKSLPADKFLLAESADIVPFMQSSGMLISDTSSVVYEYMVQNPRIVLVDPKRKDLPFRRCRPSELRQAIDDVLYGTTPPSRQIQQLMDSIHPYRDGLSAQRILDFVTDPGAMERMRQLPKKMNFFRRLKLRYYDRYKIGYVK